MRVITAIAALAWTGIGTGQDTHTVLPAVCPLPSGLVPRLLSNSDPLTVGAVSIIRATTAPFAVTALHLAQPHALVFAGQTTPPFNMGRWLAYPRWGLGCSLWADQTQLRLGIADPIGRFRPGFVIPDDPDLIGVQVWLQAFTQCPACPLGFAPTNGLEAWIE